MCSEYKIQMNGIVVGRAQVSQEGLYLHILCKCSFTEAGVYKIEAEGPSGIVNLGTCVLNQGIFGLDTRVPVKRLGLDGLIFRVAIPQRNTEHIIIPVFERETFAYITRLGNAKLIIQNGKHYIKLRN